MLEGLLNLLVRWRLASLAVALGGAVVLALFWPELRLDDSAQRWMPLSSQTAWTRFREHFASGDSIAVGMEFHRPVRDEDIEHLRALRLQLGQIADVLRVYDVSLVAEQIEGVPLTTLLAPEDAARFDLYSGALFDGVNRASLHDRTLVAICELREFDISDLRDAGPRVVQALDRVLQRHRRKFSAEMEGITVHLAGGLIVQRELERIAQQMAIGEFDAARRDFESSDASRGSGPGLLRAAAVVLRHPPLLPLCLAVALVVFTVGFRSLRALAITVLGVAWATALILGGIGAADISLNVVTVTAPSLMAVVGMATAVHFAHYHSEENANDSGHELRWIALPCLGAALTTGTGFLMLAFNQLRPVRELGFELFLGSLLAFFGVFLAGATVRFGATARGAILTAERFAAFAAAVTRRPALWAGAMLGVIAGMFFSASKVYVDADPFSFFRPDSAIARALRHLTQNDFGLYPLEVALMPRGETRVALERLPEALRFPPEIGDRVAYRAAQRELVYRGVMNDRRFNQLRALNTEAEYQRAVQQLYEQSQRWKDDRAFRRRVERFVAQAERRPGILKALSTVSFEQRVQKFRTRMRELAATDLFGAAVEVQRTLQQVALFQESFVGWSTDRADEGAVRITFFVRDNGEGFTPLIEDVKALLPEGDVEAVLTGTVATVVALSENLVGGIALGLTASLLVMALLCGVLLGSVRLALIAALPNLFPLVVVFGAMGLSCWLGPQHWAVPVNSGSAMVATIALGIALNDTIHFLLYYRRQTREEGLGVRDAIGSTFRHVGRPIVVTSAVHVVGFSVFLLSDFQPLYHFGMLSMLAMIAALIGDLVLLPNLLVLFDRAEPRRSTATT